MKRSKIASMSTKELVARRTAAEEAEKAEALRLRREKAEALRAEAERLVNREQAALEKLCAHPRKGVKGALGVSEFICFKVLEVRG